jgi:hypothetical protein
MSLRPPLPRAKTTAKTTPIGSSKAGLAHKKKLEGVAKPTAPKKNR